MKEVMYQIQPLILTENVLPIIRKSKETRDIKNYFEKPENETKNLKNMEVYKIPSLATEMADSKDKKDMLFLNSLNCCLHLEEKSVKEEFINLWKNDFLNGADINSICMILYSSNINMKWCKIILDRLKNEVDYINFSRSNLIDYVLKLNIPGHIKQLIQNRVSWLYLKANAKASQSDFYLSNSMDNILVSKANLGIYVKLLERFGINEMMIQSLSMEELLRIKNSSEYIYFIGNYNQLVENICFEQMDLVEKINKRIDIILIQENIKRKIWNKLSRIYGLSGTIFVGLIINYFSSSDINNIALGISGGLTTFSYILNKLEYINKSISKTSFIDFRDYIIKEEYKRKMQRSINE